MEDANNAGNNLQHRYAMAIVAKTVATAFLWATDAVISGKLDAAGTAYSIDSATTVFDAIVDSLASLTWANNRVNTDAMKQAAGIPSSASKAFNLIVSAIDAMPNVTTTIIQATGGTVRNNYDINPRGVTSGVPDSLLARCIIPTRDNEIRLHSSRNKTGDARSLHYLENGELKTAAVGDKAALAVNGRIRFDTVLIRNLVFIVNLYRSVRMKLQQDLTYSKDIVTKSLPITRAQLTEFSGNAGWKGRDDRKNSRYE